MSTYEFHCYTGAVYRCTAATEQEARRWIAKVYCASGILTHVNGVRVAQ